MMTLTRFFIIAGAKGPDDFYTNTTMQGYFKDYATMFANPTNTVTGVPYKDEPAILAWKSPTSCAARRAKTRPSCSTRLTAFPSTSNRFFPST